MQSQSPGEEMGAGRRTRKTVSGSRSYGSFSAPDLPACQKRYSPGLECALPGALAPPRPLGGLLGPRTLGGYAGPGRGSEGPGGMYPGAKAGVLQGNHLASQGESGQGVNLLDIQGLWELLQLSRIGVSSQPGGAQGY